MAPVEFEKQIKDRLEERRIQPSPDAWNKISGRVTRKAVGKKTAYYRYAIAAVLSAVLLAVYWIYKSPEKLSIDEAPVVESPDLIPEDGNYNELNSGEISPALVIDDNRIESSDSVDQDSDSEPLVEQTNQLASQENETPFHSDKPDRDTDILINTKIDEVVAQVTSIEEDQDAITDAEVDSLLRNAQKELFADMEFQEGYSVSASSLLAGVEEELDESFRDQVFEKLKKGFIKVRTAVADRNK